MDARERDFASAVLDALDSHICVVDQAGVIIAVNRAWRDFTDENPPTSSRSGVGMHYLNVCRRASGPGSEEADEFAVGVQSVLEGKAGLYQCEYPCHSPTEHRWFLGRVTPLEGRLDGAVVSHLNITERKLMEFELERLAATDALTGLPNRRYFLESARRELERVRRFGLSASIVMIDVDHFKAVNDSYGHAAGDEALRCVAKACSLPLRKVDILARFGGEEFVLLLPSVDEEGALKVAERLRAAVAEAPVEHGSDPISLTASFGVAAVQPDDLSIETSLERADLALYAAKRAGRNRAMGSLAAA